MKRILITDIGSTTTKAILVEITDKTATLAGLYNSPTTVEKPFEDVKYGIINSVRGLEKELNIELISEENPLRFNDDIEYLTTSSAGGGLQILVVGLTRVESAARAQKTALGAGGVVLETIAIDDKRSVLEQMEIIQATHPDIILFSGGYDGGAFTSIIRLSEILSIAHPEPKFGKEKIPLVYAGNKSITESVSGIFKDKFDLHIVPNISPTPQIENFGPAQEKVHELFMENVMEQAPGYSNIKSIVKDDIIPTPKAVLNSMEILSGERKLNLMTVDIGGATTDIFSNLNGKNHRTVRANSGMSYSISNVLADAGVEKIKRWLPDAISEEYLCNYISNKMLYPQFVPKDQTSLIIEQACAIEAINIAFKQHMEMHFDEAQRNLFANIKSVARDPFIDHVYVERVVDGMRFSLAELDVVIGAGGVISHAPDKLQALHMIIHGFRPIGITEIWRDKHFISPHLGKLSEIMPKEADELLNTEGIEKLGLYIRPKFKRKRKPFIVMTVQLGNENHYIMSNEYYIFDKKGETTLRMNLEKNVFVDGDKREISVTTDLPIIINTLDNDYVDYRKLNDTMKLYSQNIEVKELNTLYVNHADSKIVPSEIIVKKELPYDGTIEVKVGEKVKPETLVGINRKEPPKLMMAPIIKVLGSEFTPEKMENGLLCRRGEEVDFNQRIFEHLEPALMGISKSLYYYNSPTSGYIEQINCKSGIILIREKLKHAHKPIVIDIASKLKIKPSQIKGYMSNRIGDIVYEHEVIAKRVSKQVNVFVRAKATGFITEIDTTEGTVTVHYNKKPFELMSHVNGEVIYSDEVRVAEIKCVGLEADGVIGFGEEKSGDIVFVESNSDILKVEHRNKIVVCSEMVSSKHLSKCKNLGILGLIAPSIENREWVKFSGYEIGVALTGNEKIGFGFIITEGFGDFKMRANLTDLFRNSVGKTGYISPATQIRAGVKRPYLIVQ